MVSPKNKTNKDRRSKEPKYVNYLAFLDKEATTLQPGDNWCDYPYFALVRYPHLRPERVGPAVQNEPRFLAKLREDQEQEYVKAYQDFRGEVSKSESKVALHPEACQALQGLDEEQRQQLGALLLDSKDRFATYRRMRKHNQQLRNLESSGIRQLGVLNRKLAVAVQALKDLQSYARRVNPFFNAKYLGEATRCLTILERVPNPHLRGQLDIMIKNPSFAGQIKPVSRDHLRHEMVMFYWFFRHGCGLTGDESEVRVALIRNAFWKTYGAKEVAFRTEYEAGEQRGCGTVRQAVRRFRLPEGTTN